MLLPRLLLLLTKPNKLKVAVQIKVHFVAIEKVLGKIDQNHQFKESKALKILDSRNRHHEMSIKWRVMI